MQEGSEDLGKNVRESEILRKNGIKCRGHERE